MAPRIKRPTLVSTGCSRGSRRRASRAGRRPSSTKPSRASCSTASRSPWSNSSISTPMFHSSSEAKVVFVRCLTTLQLYCGRLLARRMKNARDHRALQAHNPHSKYLRNERVPQYQLRVRWHPMAGAWAAPPRPHGHLLQRAGNGCARMPTSGPRAFPMPHAVTSWFTRRLVAATPRCWKQTKCRLSCVRGAT